MSLSSLQAFHTFCDIIYPFLRKAVLWSTLRNISCSSFSMLSRHFWCEGDLQAFLTYGIIIWGNTYKTTLQPIFILQKRAMRLITFSRFDEHSSPLFKSLEIIKFLDLVTFHLAIFMYKYHNQLLPSVFSSFFSKISQIHTYNTRLGAKQSYYLPKARTNYGIFNIRFQGPSVWNSIDEDIKLSSLSLFKKKVKQQFIKDY